MTMVASTVGIRGPSLYYHFADKSSILRAIAEENLNRALIFSTTQGDEYGSFAERIFVTVWTTINFLINSPYDLKCLFDPVFRQREFYDVSRRLREWQDGVERQIVGGVQSGEFINASPSLAAALIAGLIESSISRLQNSNQRGKLTAADVSTYMAQSALRGLMVDQAAVPVGEELDDLVTHLEATAEITDVVTDTPAQPAT